MAPPPTRPQHHLDLGSLPQLIQPQNRSESSTAASSPIEQPGAGQSRFPQAEGGSMAAFAGASVSRRNTGSPSNDHNGSRFYPRRARELQSEGRPLWGPPTASGLSTPLRETIPESPGDDTFPDMGTANNAPPADSSAPQRAPSLRRGRAGTVPSQFPAIGSNPGAQQDGSTKSSARPTPSTSPFRPASSSISGGIGRSNSSASATAKASLLSRFRAGSMPQRSSFLSSGSSASSSPFGPTIFSTSWIANRDRANTHTGNQSTDPLSPPTSAFPKDLSDADVKTLDYLGLVDPPQQSRTAESMNQSNYLTNAQQSSGIQPLLANLASLNRNNRFRSYSVNAKERYAGDEDEPLDYPNYYSGTMTPSAEFAAAALAATQAEIHQHNLEVQAFANQASSSRPRARTAGVLDKPSSRKWRGFPSNVSGFNVDPSVNLGMMDSSEYQGLNEAVRALQLQGGGKSALLVDPEGDTVSEQTRALWLGGIPPSTTSSSLKAAFEAYGRIESARVLTHKSCGFVNFETIESAVRAKAHLNGQEIFPGAGPVRIGYAKAPSANGTPGGANSHFPSPSPDPFTGPASKSTSNLPGTDGRTRGSSGAEEPLQLTAPSLLEIQGDIINLSKELGASDDDQVSIARLVEEAVRFDRYEPEIPSVSEPSHSRQFDAPKLRDIRKRIDNNAYSPEEIEEIALSMLPEIAELSSDYLGNTVVQKLFEWSPPHIKEAMLQPIAPHLAEIGVHKNGTWAAQKIIDVANTPTQMSLIVDNLRPYATAAFLDQYGNYVMQCCLKFSTPFNNFIFQAMLSQLWTIAQGRFGARAMRACLESHFATKDQQRMLAATIAIHGVQLATNANGALLLTWFLDTCNFPNRRKVLAPRLVPHLVHLCTHKVAYLTVLKIVNQRNEPEARDIILKALFFSADDQVLEAILRDQSCGVMLVFKVLTTPSFEQATRNEITENVRRVLSRMKVQSSQGYKRLMDEVGLSTRATTSGRESTGRDGQDNFSPGPGLNNAGIPPIQGMDRSANGTFGLGQGMPMQQPQRNASVDSNVGYEQYTAGAPPGIFPPGLQMPGASPMGQVNNLQYQQAMLGARQPQMPYNMNTGVGNGYVNAGMSPVDPFRNGPVRPGMQSHNSFPNTASNPMAQNAGFRPQTAYTGMSGPQLNMWYQQQQQQQQHQQQAHGQQQFPGYMMSQQQQATMGTGSPRGRR